MTQKMITGVFGLAYDGNGKFLLTQRIDTENAGAHMKWQIPGGGMEFGEQPEQTAVRELQEEIKCTPQIIQDRPTVVVSVWPAKAGEDIEYHVTLITYLVTVGDQIPQATDESFDCKWYTVDEVQALDTLPNVKETVLALSKIV